jgi:hypothetical protein
VTHRLSFMTRNNGSRLVYLCRAWLAVMLGTALIAVLAVLVFPVAETAQEAPPPPFLGFVLLWPAVSSLALWGVLEVLRRALPTYWHAAGGAALVFAGVFTLASGVQGGLIFAWPYFLYALTFLAWHLRSDLEGLTMTFALQVAVNAALNLLVFETPA